MRHLMLLLGVVAVCLLAGQAPDAGAESAAPWVGAQVGGTVAPDGKTEIQIDLPMSEQRSNITSRGQGCCVQTSINHSARWQNVPALVDFQEWVKAKGLPGGAYPGAIDQRIPACAKDRGYPTPAYLQIEGRDLEVLKAACRSGRMPGVTYSFSPTGRYQGQRVAHMTNLVHADDHYFAILDNNYICSPKTPDNYEWLTPAEFARTYAGNGQGWTVILLDPGPPPFPKN